MKPDDAHAYTVSHPKKRSVRFFKFDGNDMRWNGVWIAILLITGSVIDGPAKAISLMGIISLWLLSMVLLPNEIRLYYLPAHTLRELKLKFRKGIIWQAGADKRSLFKKSTKAAMPLEVHGFDELGIIYNRLKNTDSLVFQAPGSIISSYGLSGQFVAHKQIAEMIRKSAATAGSKIQISFGLRARPEDPWAFWDTLATIGERDVLITEAQAAHKHENDYTDYDRRMKAIQTFQIHLTEIDNSINDVDMVMVVTVQRPEVFRRALKKGSIKRRDMASQPIMRIKNLVVPSLEKILQAPVTVLDVEGAERFLRKAWDVADLPEYYNNAHERIANGEEATVDQWFPKSIIRAGRTFIQIDNTFSSTIVSTAFPAREPYPFEPRIHYASESRWFAHGVIGETVSGGLEYGVLNTSHGLLTDLVSILGIQWTGPKVERREGELYDRLQEIDQSTFTESYNVLASVSASSKEELDEKVQLEIDRLTAEGRSPVLVTGYSRQLPYFLTATTLIDLC